MHQYWADEQAKNASDTYKQWLFLLDYRAPTEALSPSVHLFQCTDKNFDKIEATLTFTQCDSDSISAAAAADATNITLVIIRTITQDTF